MTSEELFIRTMANNGDGAADWAVQEIDRLRARVAELESQLANVKRTIVGPFEVIERPAFKIDMEDD